MATNVWPVLLILICLWVCPMRICGFSWNISSSSAATGGDRAPMMVTEFDGAVADFVMGGVDDPRGLKLLENARNKLAGPRNCWQVAYRKLFASCGEIMADKERQSRLAWHLSSCFQEDSGRPPFPSCAEGSRTVQCRKRLSESEGKVFLEFFLETNTLCHQLRVEAFKKSAERLINDLARSSKPAEEKLEVIEERSDQILRESVQDTVSSVEMQANNLTEALKHVREQINDVLVYSKSILEQSKKIAATQEEASEGQMEMRDEESYVGLANGLDKLKEEIEYIQREINSGVESMSSKMHSVAGKSLENQMQLSNGQTQAMGGPNKLHRFQEQVLEESRDYDVLNHELLQTLVEKVRALAEKAGGRAQSSYGSEEEEPVGLRRAGRRSGQQDGPNIRLAAGAAVASNPKPAQPSRRGGGDRREVENYVTTSVSGKYNLWPPK